MKRVLIITASARRNSNSGMLADEFAKGAVEAGHQVEQVSLAGKEIGFCKGCLACQTAKRCVIRDDADAIEQKMAQADVLVLATPIYYNEMSGQLKTMLDRGNPLYVDDYRFRQVYLLCTAAFDSEDTWRRAAAGVEGWVECFPLAKMSGVVFAGGVTDPGEARGHTSLGKAYELGKAL